ncbi:hypothetical protein ACFLUJ_08120 [Chloroflexota bacterium]
MKALKGISLGLLNFLLFLSITIFGLVFLLNTTILNPDFIASQLERLDASLMIEEFLSESSSEDDFSEELQTTMIDTIDKLEPTIKKEISAATDSIYDYLLGKRENPDLALTLGDTFMSSEFIGSVMDKLDLASLSEELLSEQISGDEFPDEFGTTLINTITELEPSLKQQVPAAADPIFDYLLGTSQSLDLALTLRNTILTSDLAVSLVNELELSPLATEFLGEQLIGSIPEEMEFLAEQLDDTIAELEPTIKEALVAATDPLLDYLLGESQSISIVISLEPVIAEVEDILSDTFMESLPDELAGLPQSILDQYLDDFFGELAEVIPATFELDESLIDPEIRTQITEALADVESELEQVRYDITEALVDAEDALEEARQYVGYFQLGYKLLIGLIVLLIAGIILINRQVKNTTRGLGITFLTYGVIEFAGVLVTKHFARIETLPIDIPVFLEEFLVQLANDFVAPLQMFSLGLLIGGIVLIIVSFTYPRWRQSESEKLTT